MGRGRKDDAAEFDVSLSLSQTYYFYRKSILFACLPMIYFILNSKLLGGLILGSGIAEIKSEARDKTNTIYGIEKKRESRDYPSFILLGVFWIMSNPVVVFG
jgi:hypothetical protein